MQAVAVQIPDGLRDSFVGAAPHITISFAEGSTAKQAGVISCLVVYLVCRITLCAQALRTDVVATLCQNAMSHIEISKSNC